MSNKKLSIVLSAIMLISMVAMGTAVFAGSAAAQNIDGDIEDGSVIADGANSGDSATHIYRIEVGDGELGETNTLRNITIDTENVDFTDVLAQGEQAVNIDGEDDLNIWVDGTPVVPDDSETVDVTVDDDDSRLIIGDETHETGDADDLTEGGYATSLDDGQIVTVQIGDSTDITNPGSSDSVDVTIGDDNDKQGSINELTLALDDDAPIAYDDDGDVSTNENHTVVDSALAEIDGTGDNVTVEGTVDNTDPTGTGLFDTTANVDEDEVVIEGDDGAEIQFDSDVTDELIELANTADETEISDLTFDAADESIDVIGSGDDGVYNVSITENTFQNVDDDVLQLDVDDDSSNPVTVELDDNTFDSTGEIGEVDLGDIGASAEHELIVTDTTADDAEFSGDQAIDITGTPGEPVTAYLEGNTLVGDQGDTTGINIDANTDVDVEIDQGEYSDDPSTIQDFDLGIDVTTAGDFNVSDNEDTVINVSTDTDDTGILIGTVTPTDELVIENVDIRGQDDSVKAIEMDDDEDLNVTDASLGTNGWEVDTGIDVSDLEDDLHVHGDVEIWLASGATAGIDASDVNNDIDGDVVVEDVTINGDGDGTAVDATDDAATFDVLVNQNVRNAQTESTLENVGTGIDVDTNGGAFEITETDLNVTDTGVQIDDIGSDVVLDNLEVEGATDSETAVAVADTGFDVNVTESTLGTDDQRVQTGIEIANADGDFHVQDDVAIWIDDTSGATGVDASDVSSTLDQLLIEGVDIVGDGDAGSTGVDASDGDSGPVDVDQEQRVSDTTDISDVGVGIVVEGSNNFAITGTEFSAIADTGIDVAEVGSATTIEDITVENSADATGVHVNEPTDDVEVDGATVTNVSTGVDIDDGSENEHAVNDSTITTEADDQVGVLLTDTTGSDDDILIFTNSFEAEGAADSTAVQVDDANANVEIQFNDIEGFTGDAGYGLAGDDIDELDRESAIGNWWGSDFGPQHEDASNVDIDVDADADASSVYDPFLTTNIEDTDLDLDNPANDQVLDFAHDIYVQEGEIGTVAFPSYSANELTQGDAYELIGGESADIVRYDADSDDWVGGAENNEIPEGLDAYAVIADDTDVLFKVEYEDDDNVIRGDYTYESGWNLVPTAASNDDIGSTDDQVDQSNTFDLDSQSDGEFTSAFDSPGLQINPSSDIKTATDGDQLDSLSENEVSAFHPMWVYVEGSSVGETNTAAFDPDADMQDVLDSIEQSN